MSKIWLFDSKWMINPWKVLLSIEFSKFVWIWFVSYDKSVTRVFVLRFNLKRQVWQNDPELCLICKALLFRYSKIPFTYAVVIRQAPSVLTLWCFSVKKGLSMPIRTKQTQNKSLTIKSRSWKMTCQKCDFLNKVMMELH